MDIEQVRCFLAIVDEGGFGRAAARLHLSTSAVSRRLKDLERGLRAELFIRGPHGVELTQAGTALVEPARRALESFESLTQIARHPDQGADRPPRLGVTGSMPPMPVDLFRGAVARVLGLSDSGEDAPTLVAAPSAAVMARMEVGEVDLALVHMPPIGTALTGVPVGRLRWQIAMPSSHPLASRSRVSIADLRGERLALLPRDVHPPAIDALASRLSAEGVIPYLPPTDNIMNTAHLVRAGEVLTVVQHRQYGGKALVYTDDGYALADLDDEIPEWTLGVIWRRGSSADRWARAVAHVMSTRMPGLGLRPVPVQVLLEGDEVAAG